MVAPVRIGTAAIGEGHPCFLIAEAGVNHDGSLEVARALVDAAVAAGVDAVKFQTFDPDQLATADAPKAAYQLESTNTAESQLDMLRRLVLSPEAHVELIRYCASRQILFLSTPFDESSALALHQLGLPAFKISSGDLTNLPFLDFVARLGKPLLLSTGMATEAEVAEAVATVRAAGDPGLVLLQCVSNYPAAPEHTNLRAMETMARAFEVPVGYSDHTLGIDIALAAVALGAHVVEKHLTLDRRRPGPDHQASIEPAELKALVRGVRDVEAALGHGRKEPSTSEAEVARVARKSIVAAMDIPPGTVMSREWLAMRRPGTGLRPSMLPRLVGRVTTCTIPAGTLISEDMFA